MRISKEKGVLFFTKDNGDSVSVSLIDGTMNEKINNTWVKRKSLTKFFSGYCIYDIDKWDYKEEHRYLKSLIRLIFDSKYTHATNIGTALKHLHEFTYEESLFKQGFDVWHKLDNKLHTTKQVIKIFKHCGALTNGKVEVFNNKTFQLMVSYTPLDRDYLRELLSCFKYLDSERFYGFLKDHKLNLKSFSEYLYYTKIYEGIDRIVDVIGYLEDYYIMNIEMGRKFEKYPKFLKSKHDITVACYNLFQQKYDEEKFKDAYKDVDYSYRSKIYSIIKPIDTADVRAEGSDLGHCVASYVPKIIDNMCQIYFMRKNDDIENRLITIEVSDNKVIQVKGAGNRHPYRFELDFIREWADEFGLEVSVS